MYNAIEQTGLKKRTVLDINNEQNQLPYILLFSRHFIFTDLLKSCIMKQFTLFIFTGGGEGFQLGIKK